MKYISQHCCDKTTDDKMALYGECCFQKCIKLWWKQLLSYFSGGGAIAPIDPWIRPYTRKQNYRCMDFVRTQIRQKIVKYTLKTMGVLIPHNLRSGPALASAGPDLKHFCGAPWRSVVCRNFWGGASGRRLMIEISDVTKARPEKVTPKPLL